MKTFKVEIILLSKEIAHNLNEELNNKAKEGWELVSITPFSEAGLTQFAMQASTTSGFILVYRK